MSSLPHLTKEQMIKVDRAMNQHYGFELLKMMENAGRGFARLAATRFLRASLPGKKVIVLAGRGGKGGCIGCRAATVLRVSKRFRVLHEGKRLFRGGAGSSTGNRQATWHISRRQVDLG